MSAANATPISREQALHAAKEIAVGYRFAWSDETVVAVLDDELTHQRCWRITLWPAHAPDQPRWQIPNDIVTELPPDIVIDAQTGDFVGLKPLRGALIAAENIGRPKHTE